MGGLHMRPVPPSPEPASSASAAMRVRGRPLEKSHSAMWQSRPPERISHGRRGRNATHVHMFACACAMWRTRPPSLELKTVTAPESSAVATCSPLALTATWLMSSSHAPSRRGAASAAPLPRRRTSATTTVESSATKSACGSLGCYWMWRRRRRKRGTKRRARQDGVADRLWQHQSRATQLTTC